MYIHNAIRPYDVVANAFTFVVIIATGSTRGERVDIDVKQQDVQIQLSFFLTHLHSHSLTAFHIESWIIIYNCVFLSLLSKIYFVSLLNSSTYTTITTNLFPSHSLLRAHRLIKRFRNSKLCFEKIVRLTSDKMYRDS